MQALQKPDDRESQSLTKSDSQMKAKQWWDENQQAVEQYKEYRLKKGKSISQLTRQL